MSRFNERLFSKFDAVAEQTGIPAVARGEQRRRRLRWVPVPALAIASLGFIAGLIRAEMAAYGLVLVMLAYAIAVMLPMFGPLKPWGTPERVDEFDRALRSRAMLAGYAATSVGAFLGIWLVIGFATLGNWPREHILQQLAALPFYLLVLHSAVPTLYASWAIRPIDDD